MKIESDTNQELLGYENSMVSTIPLGPDPSKGSGEEEGTPKESKQTRRGCTFEVLTMNELLDQNAEAPSALVSDLFYKGQLSILSARPKVGKSTLARFLSVKIVKGEPFLGRETLKGKVLYIAMEEDSYNLTNDFRAMGVLGSDSIVIAKSPTSRDDLIKQVQNLIIFERPDLVVIDTMIHVIRIDDLNDYSKSIRALLPLLELARISNAHVMLIHHSNKGGGNSETSVLGSTAITGMVDTIVNLSKDEQTGSRVISSSQRLGATFEKQTLVFDSETKSFGLGGIEVPCGRDYKGEIIEFVEGSPESTEAEIKLNIKGKATNISKALKYLSADGKELVRTGSGKAGNPFRYSLRFVEEDESPRDL